MLILTLSACLWIIKVWNTVPLFGLMCTSGAIKTPSLNKWVMVPPVWETGRSTPGSQCPKSGPFPLLPDFWIFTHFLLIYSFIYPFLCYFGLPTITITGYSKEKMIVPEALSVSPFLFSLYDGKGLLKVKKYLDIFYHQYLESYSVSVRPSVTK